MRRLLPIALLALLGFALAGGASADSGGPFAPDPAAEADACDKAVTDRPKIWAGISQGDIGDADWLSRVAFHLAYGSWPDTSDAMQAERLGALIECVTKKLAEQVDPNEPAPPADLPIVAEFPIPGTYYRIQFKDQLLGSPATGGVASRAYNTSGNANYQRSKLINDHPYNLRFRKFFEKEANLYPTGRISFNPTFGSFAEQYDDPASGADGKGNEYAVIYIPEVP
jgi:hypothetical protein